MTISNKASEWLQSLSPDAAIARCVERLGLLPFVRTLPMGETHAGNLIRILSLIREWSAQGLHWGQVVTELRALIDDRDYKIEQMTIPSAQEDVVRLMNLHQAKGLQGKIVFLADPYDTSYTRYGPEFHVSRTRDEPFLALPITKPRGPYQREVVAEPVGWEDAQAEETRFLQGEELRLLYVAATRAENLLIVSTYEEKPDHGPWSPLYPHLKDMPELAYDDHSSHPTSETPSTKMPSVELEREQRNQFWQAVKKQSFEVAQVTDDRPDITYTDERRTPAGKGAAYGTVIHQIFDDAINMRLPADPTPYVAHLLQEAGADAGFYQTHWTHCSIFATRRYGRKYRLRKPYIPKSPLPYRKQRTTPTKLFAASSTWSIAFPKDGKSSITKPMQ